VKSNDFLKKESELDCEICPKCNTKRYTFIEFLGKKKKVTCLCLCQSLEYKRQQEEERKKEMQYRLDRLRSYSLMDQNFINCTFENFAKDEQNLKYYKLAYNYCKNWNEMQKENMGFLFYGPPGIGKTYLTFCIANKLLKNFVPVIAISTIGLLNRIKETYKKYGQEGEIEVINSLKNASLLILDDLGAENDTDWTKAKIYEIIDSRYRTRKPMIVTTNLSIEQLKLKLQSEDGVNRTFDRLLEICTPIGMEGKSRRKKAASDKTEIIKRLINE